MQANLAMGFEPHPERPASALEPRPGRPPELADFLLFFLAVPLGAALWFAAIGMSPTPQLGFAGGFVFIAIQVCAAWWANAAASAGLARALSHRQVSPLLLMAGGFALAWLPLCLFYKSALSPLPWLFPSVVIVSNGPWTGEYLLRLLRFSLPFLPIWVAAVYGYRYLRGVQWFATAPRRSGNPGSPAAAPARAADAPGPAPGVVGTPVSAARPHFLNLSRLPARAELIAFQAQEHYLQLWTTAGSDLVRYRFGDALTEAAALPGGQVHRSWWVSWSHAAAGRRRGRSLELVLDNGVKVPVSLAYKARALEQLRHGSSSAG